MYIPLGMSIPLGMPIPLGMYGLMVCRYHSGVNSHNVIGYLRDVLYRSVTLEISKFMVIRLIRRVFKG